MEFEEVVRRRRMVRRYSPEPVDAASLDKLLQNAMRAPSAGFAQGWAFLVLDQRADVERFWKATTPADRSAKPNPWLRNMRVAPVVIVPLSSKELYLDRYAEADKGWADRDEARWPVPYWHVDAGMASLLTLLTAVDEGLGACFFGVPAECVPSLRAEFGIPSEYAPVGAITVGYADPTQSTKGSGTSRERRPSEDVIHRGHWSL